MAATVLLYGADEFIGRLIAQEAVATWTSAGSPDLVLSGRRLPNLLLLGAELGLTVNAFDWRDSTVLAAEVAKVDIVVNASTPFEKTVDTIAKATLTAGRSYLDVNTELDVERMLAALEQMATNHNGTVVCGGGPSAAMSSLMVEAAIRDLHAKGVIAPGDPLGTIRIAVSCVAGLSRSSAASIWRALSRDVAVGTVGDDPLDVGSLAIDYGSRPIGQLERSFDFGLGANPAAQICVGASLADSHAAALSSLRGKHKVGDIETYVASTRAGRVAYPLGAATRTFLAPAYTFPSVNTATALGFELWPGGPPRIERSLEHFEIVLQIEDGLKTTVVDWRLRGPDLYDMTARLTAQMALQLAAGVAPAGLVTPADLIAAAMTKAQPIASMPDVALERRVLA